MYQDDPLGYPRFIGSMRLPGAYRSLARPSSAPKPSHPLTGIKLVQFRQTHVTSLNALQVPVHGLSLPRFYGVSSPSPAIYITGCTGTHTHSGPVGI
jgi:hypothetical protein